MAGDVTVTHEAAAELAARATYAVTALAIGDHKKATAGGAEHDTLKAGYASYFAHRGIVLVGGVALAAVLVCYLLGEARREEVVGTVKRWFGGLGAKKAPNVASAPAAAQSAASAVVDIEPAQPMRAPAGAGRVSGRVDSF